MERLVLFTFLLLFRYHLQFVSAQNSTNFGKRFLVSVPFAVVDSQKNVYSEITFTLHSLRNINFEVLITAGTVCKNQTVLIGLKHNSTLTMQDCTGNLKNATEVIRTPYILTGPHLFSVTVTTNHYNFSFETMMVVPVEGWGTSYFAMTLRNKPTIQIITDVANEVKIIRFLLHNSKIEITENITKTLPAQSSYEYKSCIQNSTGHNGTTIDTYISAQKPIGLVTGDCQGAAFNEKCAAPGKNIEDLVAKTVVTESLLPMESYGKDFIAYNPFNESNSTYVVVFVTENFTMVNISIGQKKSIVVPLAWSELEVHNITKGVRITSNRSVQVMAVRKSKCISGGGNYKGQTALSLVLPTALYLSTYNWRTPKTPDANIVDYVIFISTLVGQQNMILDGGKLLNGTNMNWTLVEGTKDWFSVEVLLSNKSLKTHYATSLERRTPFGCYLFGIHNTSSYMHPAGFISSDLRRQKNCVTAQYIKTPSDYVDNDCDGKVDEETINGIDDDQDLLVDEDTVLTSKDGQWSNWTNWMCLNCTSTQRKRERTCSSPEVTGNGIDCFGETLESGSGPCESNCTTTNGTSTTKSTGTTRVTTRMINTKATTRITVHTGRKKFNFSTGTTVRMHKTAAWEANAFWDAWTEWRCVEPCFGDRMFRMRKCFDKKVLKESKLCEGPSTEETPADCKKRCAQKCPAFKWRTDCKGDCSNCEEDCDKLNGSCIRCRPGYQNPHMSCSDVCDPFHYGYMCQEQCAVKCNGDDCVDRRTGQCPEQGNTAWIAFLLLIIPPIFILLYLRYKHIQAGREDPLAFIVESPSNLGITKSNASLGASRSRSRASLRSGTNLSLKRSGASIKSSRSQKSMGARKVRSSSAVN